MRFTRLSGRHRARKRGQGTEKKIYSQNQQSAAITGTCPAAIRVLGTICKTEFTIDQQS